MASATTHTHEVRSIPRSAFAGVLLIAWTIMALLFVYSTIHAVIEESDVMAAVTAVAALALLTLLAGMEGLEVAVIDRWRNVFVDGDKSHLAAWLAARQFFVAIIVTTATLLAHRDYIAVPGTDAQLTEGLLLGLYDLVIVGLMVLWFAQILPKHMAATNPDRYLRYTRASLFPCVEVIRMTGVPKPAEWVAGGVERSLDWYTKREEEIEEAPARHEDSLADIWRELIPEGPERRR
jgi:CBS domain containing-hemolysin-like protein